MIKQVTVIAVISLLTISATTTGAHAAERRLKSIKVAPQPFLGLSFPGPKADVYHVMSEAGIGVVRTSISWKHREPRAGKLDWTGLDRRIAHLQKLGIEPFLTMESNAPWAVRPESKMLTNGTPKDLRAWQRFVKAAVERYDGDGKNDAPGLKRPVRYFQFANEWPSPTSKAGGWAGSTTELIEFLNASYDAVKAQSSDAVVVLGGVASGSADGLVVYEGQAAYNLQSRASAQARVSVTTPKEVRAKPRSKKLHERILQVTRKARYDMADIHLYGPVGRDLVRIKTFRQRIGNRELVSAECGGPSMAYNKKYIPQDHFIAVMDRNLTILSEGLKFCLWFRLGEVSGVGHDSYNNSYTALFDKKRQPKPGYWAFKLLAAILDDMTRVERTGQDGQFIIHRRGKKPLFVAWQGGASKSAASAALPKGVGGDVLRITDAIRGVYTIEKNAASKQIKLSALPTVVGNLPASLSGAR